MSLRQSIDLTTPSGRLMLVVLAGVAAFETEVRSERQLAGVEAARQANGGKCPWGGRKVGVRIKLTREKESTILRLAEQGEAKAAIARIMGLSRPTVYAMLDTSR